MHFLAVTVQPCQCLQPCLYEVFFLLWRAENVSMKTVFDGVDFLFLCLSSLLCLLHLLLCLSSGVLCLWVCVSVCMFVYTNFTQFSVHVTYSYGSGFPVVTLQYVTYFQFGGRITSYFHIIDPVDVYNFTEAASLRCCAWITPLLPCCMVLVAYCPKRMTGTKTRRGLYARSARGEVSDAPLHFLLSNWVFAFEIVFLLAKIY